MENDQTKELVLEESISSTKIYEVLTQISHRIDSLENSISDIKAMAGTLPAAMSITTDTVDEFCSEAIHSGINIDDRLKSGLKLIVQLTEPKTMKALSLLIEKMESLQPFLKVLDSLPDTLSILVDSLDEMYKNANQSGVDIELLMNQASDTALKLNELLKSDELKALMESGVLNPKTVALVGQAGCALANCKDDQPERLGLLGMLKAISNHDLQHALGFLVCFGKRFGQLIDTTKK